MKPETAAYFNDMQRRLSRDPDALIKEFRERCRALMGVPDKTAPPPKPIHPHEPEAA